ncbi:hypothetical protein PVLB_10465 [Pseudomonas sp. VLB120]|nr:hypothetical protein PVLB_10465 [Pseudomonas sp. VLB120]
MDATFSLLEGHLECVNISKKVRCFVCSAYCNQSIFRCVSDEGLGVRCIAETSVIQKMQARRILLVVSQAWVVHWIQSGVKRHDFQTSGIGHLFEYWVHGFRLLWVDTPDFIERVQRTPEPVTTGGYERKADRRSQHGVLVRVLSKWVVAERRHQRQLIQVQRTELGVRR